MSDPHSQNNSQDYLSDPDVFLMIEFQKGNVPSFETLMRKYYARILNFLYRFVGNREIAEDLTQEVFVRVYKSASSYQPQAKFNTWIYTIAKNIGLNELRRHKRRFFSLNADVEGKDRDMQRQLKDDSAQTPAARMQEKETAKIVRQAIDRLPDNQKLAVVLRRYEGFSYEQIALTMDSTVAAVKSLLSRARENLKTTLSSLLKIE